MKIRFLVLKMLCVILDYDGLLIGGDWNLELVGTHPLYDIVNNFNRRLGLTFNDDKILDRSNHTFRVFSSGARSNIDHFAVSRFVDIATSNVCVVDSGINLSDHCAIVCTFLLPMANDKTVISKNDKIVTHVLRWDKSNLSYYRDETQRLLQSGEHLENILAGNFTQGADIMINKLYDHIVSALNLAANKTVVKKKKDFYKFWWDQELSSLKEQSILSFKRWADAGKPKVGPLFAAMKKNKLLYKQAIRSKESAAKQSFTNALDSALSAKDFENFWAVWRAKVSNSKSSLVIDGLCNDQAIAERFASLFKEVCMPNNVSRHAELKAQFEDTFKVYVGSVMDVELCNTEMIDRCIASLKKVKCLALMG